MSMRYAEAVVLTLNCTVVPRLTLKSVGNPWMLASPDPLTSHSVGSLPGRQFSASMALAGDWQSACAVPTAATSATNAASERIQALIGISALRLARPGRVIGW